MEKRFSQEELSCIAQVEQAGESEKQSTFEKACMTLRNKTNIAILALTLGLSQPALAQNTYESHPQYQDFYSQIAKRYPTLSPEQQKLFSSLYVEGLSIIDPKNERFFGAYIRRIASQAESGGLAIHLIDDMMTKEILPPNHPYTHTLREITMQIDKIGQENIAQLDKSIAQLDKDIAQLDKDIAESQKRQKQYEQLTEMLEKFKK